MSDFSSKAWFGMTRAQLIKRLRQLADEIEDLSTVAATCRTRIDRWAIARRAVPCLIGIPASHPTFPDGHPLFSSELFFLDAERRIARSFSRWYELGDQVDANYWEDQYPRQREQ